MKIRRCEWEALQQTITDLKQECAALRREIKLAEGRDLMESRTGPVLTSVVVQMLLQHLNLESRHGHGNLFAIEKQERFHA